MDKYHCDNGELPEGTYPPCRGVLLRTFVEGPFGSTARTDWGDYSSVLLVGGGSGVAFILSILVYLCLCVSGRGSKFLGGHPKSTFKVSRVRFLWLAREFSHISWCAPILRRCISLVSSSALQVDIFVTSRVHKAPKPPPGTGGSGPPQLSWTPAKHPVTSNPAGDSNIAEIPLDSNSRVPIHLAPPSEGSHRRVSIDDHNSTPYDGVSGGQHDDGGLQPKDSDHEMGLGQQDTTHDVLDDGEFDGKDEEVIPGLESFNMRLREEGELRRIARKTTAGRQGQGDLEQRIETPSPPHSPRDHEAGPGDELGERDPTDSISERVSTSSSNSVGLMRDVAEVQATLPKTGRGARGEDVVLQFTDEEMEDMLVVAEFTQAGRPKLKLDLFLKEEIERAEGAIIVACCGPTQLTASIRRVVSAQIDPAKIKAGDMRGFIACVTEDFEY